MVFLFWIQTLAVTLVRLADRLDIYRSAARTQARVLVLHGEHVSRWISTGSSEIVFFADSPHTYVVLTNEIHRVLRDEVPVLPRSHTVKGSRAIRRLREVRVLRPEHADRFLIQEASAATSISNVRSGASSGYAVHSSRAMSP